MENTATPVAPTVGEQVGANVKAEMSRKGKTQNDLARVLGMSQVGVSRRLRGVTAFNVDELAAVSEALQVPIDKLLLAS